MQNRLSEFFKSHNTKKSEAEGASNIFSAVLQSQNAEEDGAEEKSKQEEARNIGSANSLD